jgi:hypothetical protein
MRTWKNLVLAGTMAGCDPAFPNCQSFCEQSHSNDACYCDVAYSNCEHIAAPMCGGPVN